MADKTVFALALVVALAGCGPKPTMQQPEAGDAAPLVAESAAFRVERVEVFRDGIAYEGRRGIYVIKDKRTGREFIGVSGIGITERSAHWVQTGKSGFYQEDER